jgi:hypothetical protein
MKTHRLIAIGAMGLLGSFGVCSFGSEGVLKGIPELGLQGSADPASVGVAKPACIGPCSVVGSWQTQVYDLETDYCTPSQPWQEEIWTSTKYLCTNGSYWSCSETPYYLSCNSTEVTNTCPSNSCIPLATSGGS